jgi:hypothetical protein
MFIEKDIVLVVLDIVYKTTMRYNMINNMSDSRHELGGQTGG